MNPQSRRRRAARRRHEPRAEPDRSRGLLTTPGGPDRQAQSHHRHRPQARHPRLPHTERHARLSRPRGLYLQRAPTRTARAPTSPTCRHAGHYARQPGDRRGTGGNSFLGVAETGARTEGHELCTQRIGTFYAEAVNGSTFRRRIAPTRRTCACSEGLSGRTVHRAGCRVRNLPVAFRSRLLEATGSRGGETATRPTGRLRLGRDTINGATLTGCRANR